MAVIIIQMVASMKGHFFKEFRMVLADLSILMGTIMKGRLSTVEQMGLGFIKIRILLIRESLKIIKNMEKVRRKQTIHFFREYFNMIKKQKAF